LQPLQHIFQTSSAAHTLCDRHRVALALSGRARNVLLTSHLMTACGEERP
jgi:hypothetical protein